jgi:hypothetical protein
MNVMARGISMVYVDDNAMGKNILTVSLRAQMEPLVPSPCPDIGQYPRTE